MRPKPDNPARWSDVERVLSQLPPHSVEAEVSLLGSMILDPDCIADVTRIVRGPESFYKPAHQTIYEALTALYDERGKLDNVMLNDRLRDEGVIDAIGGSDYLVQLAESVPSSVHAIYYAETVADKARARDVISASGAILSESLVNPSGAHLAEFAQDTIYAATDSASHNAPSPITPELQEFVTDLDEGRTADDVIGVSTGFGKLDNLTGGLCPGQVAIIAARPSMGKSAFMISLAGHMALNMGAAVGIFSLEMSRRQLCDRFVAWRTGVALSSIRRRSMNRHDADECRNAVESMRAATMIVDDSSQQTITQIKSAARRVVHRHGVRCVFIDYLQLIDCPGRDTRQQEIGAVSRGLKQIAKEMNVPVVALCQLNRNPEQRQNHRPILADLREAGDIEQDADIVAFVHRESYYAAQHEPATQSGYIPDDDGPIDEAAELILRKQRDGPLGTVPMVWDETSARYLPQKDDRQHKPHLTLDSAWTTAN